MERLDVVGLLTAAQDMERNVSIALLYSGLRVPQFRLLDALATGGPATVTEMSERMGVTRATASVMINELIRTGVLAVAAHPADRRSFHVHLSDLGVHKLKVARSDLGVFIDKLALRYPPDMVCQLNAFAAQMAAHRKGGR